MTEKPITICEDENCEYLPCLNARLAERRAALTEATDFESQHAAFARYTAMSRRVRRAAEEQRRYEDAVFAE